MKLSTINNREELELRIKQARKNNEETLDQYEKEWLDETVKCFGESLENRIDQGQSMTYYLLYGTERHLCKALVKELQPKYSHLGINIYSFRYYSRYVIFADVPGTQQKKYDNLWGRIRYCFDFFVPYDEGGY